MTDYTNPAEVAADTYGAYITDLMNAVAEEHASPNPVPFDGYDSVLEARDEYPLEVIFEVGVPFQIVLTLGGPDVRIISTNRDISDFELVVHFGRDVARRSSGAITALAEYFLESEL